MPFAAESIHIPDFIYLFPPPPPPPSESNKHGLHGVWLVTLITQSPHCIAVETQYPAVLHITEPLYSITTSPIFRKKFSQ